MPSSSSAKRTLEDLPDELLLTVCRYLSSTDVLFSFYGLNERFSQTIHSYTQHVVLSQTPYVQFRHLCTSVLPHIGLTISSLVVSNRWTGVLSRIFLEYFAERMSLTFPRLRHLSLVSFSINASNVFFDSLQNLPDLHEVNLYFQYDTTNEPLECQNLLHRMLAANNHRLHSILFDNESIIFSLVGLRADLSYSNINKLSIDIETIDDLHRLLTLLPQLVCLDVTTNEGSSTRDETRQCVPNVTIKQFRLRSFGPSWHLDDLSCLLRRVPNVEELSIAVDTFDDQDLTDGERIFAQLRRLPLTKFSYFLQFYNSSSSIDPSAILSTWHEFSQQVLCFQNDQKSILALFTLPFQSPYLLLESSVARHDLFIAHCLSQVNILTLHRVSSHAIDIFPILNASRRLHSLSLRIDESIVSQVSSRIHLGKLSSLTKIVVWPNTPMNIESFQNLLEVSPNVHHLEAKYEFISALIDYEHLWPLLERRITQLYVAVPSVVSVEQAVSTIARLPSIFPSLQNFYVKLDRDFPPADVIVLVVLKHVALWKCLLSLGVVDVTITEDSNRDTQQWVRENSTLRIDRPFQSDYIDKTFRLWL